MAAVLGVGLAALGRPGYINLGHSEDLHGRLGVEEMEGAAHDVLDVAYAGGIRYFDAARSYGRAEHVLGAASGAGLELSSRRPWLVGRGASRQI